MLSREFQVFPPFLSFLYRLPGCMGDVAGGARTLGPAVFGLGRWDSCPVILFFNLIRAGGEGEHARPGNPERSLEHLI